MTVQVRPVLANMAEGWPERSSMLWPLEKLSGQASSWSETPPPPPWRQAAEDVEMQVHAPWLLEVRHTVLAAGTPEQTRPPSPREPISYSGAQRQRAQVSTPAS